MDSSVIAAMIGVGGVVVGGLINMPEFKSLFKTSKGTGGDLRGEWLCEWFIDSKGPTAEAVVKDRIEIEKVVGGKVTATGVSPLMNEYKLAGTVSMSNVVTLTFQGTHKETLTGVIILEVNTVRDQMQGFWHQLSPDGKFVGGKTTWKRGPGSSINR